MRLLTCKKAWSSQQKGVILDEYDVRKEINHASHSLFWPDNSNQGRRVGHQCDCSGSRKQNHGGRVIFQQAGPEPLDACRDFLKEQQKMRAFQILDTKHEASKEEGARFINTPWWLMEKPPND